MASRLGIGLVGCGQVAQQYHLPALHRLQGVALTAIADPLAASREAAQAWAPRAAALAEYQALVTRADVDAVVVCAPSALHAAVARAALAHGKAVFVEKPLATELVDGAGVLAAWRKAGTVGMIGFTRREHPLYREARRLLAAGRIGPPTAAIATFTSPQPATGWRRGRVEGGGALLDLGSHHVDLVQTLLGVPVTAVQAVVRSLQSEGDTAAVLLELHGGALVQILCGYGLAAEERCVVFGPHGRLVVDVYGGGAVEIFPARPTGVRLARLRYEARALAASPFLLGRWLGLTPAAWHARALARFVAAVRAGQQAQPSLAAGYRALQVVAAAEQAARVGRRVTITEMTSPSTVQ